jgi:O-antigen/teichoic acid export membrane protein
LKFVSDQQINGAHVGETPPLSADNAATQAAAEASAQANAKAKSALLANIGWQALGEMCGRIARLLATVLLARALTPSEFGAAAAAITCFEIIRVLLNTGIGQAIVRATDEELAATCATAYRLGWWSCIFTAVLQVAVGWGMAVYTGRPELFAMIAALAGVYLIMAPGIVHVNLLVRDNRIKTVTGVATTQNVSDHLLTALFAITGFGAWAIVLPKLLTAPIWLFGVRRSQSWTRDKAAGFVPYASILTYAGPILGSEIMSATRMNLDKLLVGSVLGVEALGLYYFAFNAGIGVSLTLTAALALSSFPYFAAVARQPAELLKRFDHVMGTTAPLIGVAIAVQAVAAVTYVPLVFGARWVDAAPLVALLCVSGITKSAFDVGQQGLRAAGLTREDFVASTAFSSVSLLIFYVSLGFGLHTAITTFAVTACLLQLIFAVWARGCLVRATVAPVRPDFKATAGGVPT